MDLNENKLSNSWSDTLKSAMKESTSLFILVSSFILLFSIASDAKIIPIVGIFLFLFWAIANHFLAIFSKTETLRPYARGGFAFLLYIFISFLLFVGCVIVITTLLLINDLNSFQNFLLQSHFFRWLLGNWILLYAIWLIAIYYKKSEAERQSGQLKNVGTYSVKRYCKNCDYNSNLTGEVKIPEGTPFTDYPCPICKVLALSVSPKEESENNFSFSFKAKDISLSLKKSKEDKKI